MWTGLVLGSDMFMWRTEAVDGGVWRQRWLAGDQGFRLQSHDVGGLLWDLGSHGHPGSSGI